MIYSLLILVLGFLLAKLTATSLKTVFLRGSILSLLLFSLFPPLGNEKENPCVIVLLDTSASILTPYENESHLHSAYAKKMENIRQSLDPKDKIGALYFAETTPWALPLDYAGKKNSLANFPQEREQTNLLFALEKAITSFPPQSEKRLIIFSDGFFRELPSFWEKKLQEKRISIKWHFLSPPQNFSDSAILALSFPLSAPLNSYISGEAIVRVTDPGTYILHLQSSQKYTRQVFQIEASGQYRLDCGFQVSKTGQETIRATIEREGFNEPCTENNEYQFIVQVKEKSTILVLGQKIPPVPDFITKTISFSEFSFSSITPQKTPLIIISQMEKKELAPALTFLEKYVALGGSLFMLGSEKTLGPGGYGGTLLEKTLPVWCLPESQEPLALMILLDRSGSMAHSWKTSSKIELAKEAIYRLGEEIPGDNELALLSFADLCHIDLRWNKASLQVKTIKRILKSIFPHGSTNIEVALSKAYSEILTRKSPRKHILLISDGLSDKSQENSILEIAEKIRNLNATISVVSTGSDQEELLRKIAHRAKGKYYHAQPDSFTEILLGDFRWLNRSLITKIPKTTQAGVDINLFPPLELSLAKTVNQVVRVKPKSHALIPLQTNDEDPLLALGYYKLGKTAVLTTDPSDSNWYGSLPASNIINYTCQWLTASPPSSIQIEPTENQLKVTVQSETSSPGKIVLNKQSYDLKNKGIDQYQALLPLPDKGKHQLLWESYVGEQKKEQVLLNYLVPYPLEYRFLGKCEKKPPPETNFPSEEKKEKEGARQILLGLALILFVVERIWGD